MDSYNVSGSVSLTVDDGSDGSGSGLSAATRAVQRQSAALTSGVCGSYDSGFSTIIPTGAYPDFTDDTISPGNCYQYRYQVSDAAGNPVTYTSTNTVKMALGFNGISQNLRLLDTNANGKIDQLTFEIENNAGDSWQVNGTPALTISQSGNLIDLAGPVTITSAPGADPVEVQVNLSEADPDLAVSTSGVTSAPTELSYTQATGDQTCTNCIKDDADNELNTIATGDTDDTDTEIDAAAPVISNLQYLDNDGDGKIDRVTVSFSETVTAASTLSAANLSLTDAGDFTDAAFGANAVDLIGGAASSVAIDLGTEATAVDTRDDSGTLAISTAGVFNLTDGTNTYSTVGAQPQTTFTDGAKPLIKTVTTEDTGGDGLIDKLTLTWSENIDTDNGAAPVAADLPAALLPDGQTAVFDAASVSDPNGSSPLVVITGITGQLTPNTAAGATAISGDLSAKWKDGSGNAPDVADAAGHEAITDAAAPVYVSSKTLDNDNDGAVDFVKITYSEPISDASVANTDYAAGITDVAADTLDETFTSLTPATGNETDVADDQYIYVGVTGGNTPLAANKTDYTLHIAQTGAVADVAANSLASFTEKTSTDDAKPILVSAQTFDVGADGLTPNGKDDHLKLTFSENIDDSAINNYAAAVDYTPTSLAVANVIGEKVDAMEILGDTEDNNILYIVFDENAAACSVSDQTGCDTAAVNQDITWTGASVTIRDAAGNAAADLATGGVTEADTANPFILGANYYDSDGNGTIDNLILVFSENVNDASYLDKSSTISAGGTLTTAAIVAAGIVALDAADNDKWITLAISGGAANTTNITSTFDTVAADMIDDVSGNSSLNQSGITLIDKAAPIVIAKKYTDDNTDGRVDHVVLTLSEPFTVSTANLSDFAYAAHDITASALAGGSVLYATPDITLTLGTLGNANITSHTAAPTIAYTDDAGRAIADAAGNELASFGATGLADGAAPVIVAATGAFGTAAPLTVTMPEGVYGNDNATGDLAAPDFTYTDVSADGATSISSLTHTAGNAVLTLTLNSNLFSSDAHDTLAPAITSVYDAAGNAAGTTVKTLTVTGMDGSFILRNGWNAFSTPKKLFAISFSNGGAGLTFYKLNGDTFSTVTADITNITPLEGFLVKNTSGSDVTLDLIYQGPLDPNEKLFSKPLSAGWNIVGISNATNAATNDGTTTTDAGTGADLIDSLGTRLSEVIDFTGTVGALATPVDFATGVNTGGNAFTTGNWAIRNRNWFSGDTGDFADGKAYGIFIKAGGAVLSGHQN